jgi:hypothetical protein
LTIAEGGAQASPIAVPRQIFRGSAYTDRITARQGRQVNIRSLAKGLKYCGEAAGKRQTYYIFESGKAFVVMSASRTKRASGYFNLVSREAVERVRKNYAGKQDVTAKQLATRSRGPGMRDALQALNILYVLVATGRAKRDDRFQDQRLHFNILPK